MSSAHRVFRTVQEIVARITKGIPHEERVIGLDRVLASMWTR